MVFLTAEFNRSGKIKQARLQARRSFEQVEKKSVDQRVKPDRTARRPTVRSRIRCRGGPLPLRPCEAALPETRTQGRGTFALRPERAETSGPAETHFCLL